MFKSLLENKTQDEHTGIHWSDSQNVVLLGRKRVQESSTTWH